MEPVEPGLPLGQRRDGADERGHVDGAAGHQLDRLGILAAGRARPEERDLPRDDRLQRQHDFGREVADERDDAALADAADRRRDRLG